MHRTLYGTVLAATLIGTSACRPPLVDGVGLTAIVGGTIIDGTGAPAIADAAILIEGDRIVDVVRLADVRLGDQVTQVDARGRWIVPGFVDAHGHVLNPDSDLPTLLNHGITAVRMPASLPEMSTPVRDRIDNGELQGPTMRVAGVLIDSPHGGDGWWATVDSEDAARAEVRRQAGLGVNYVKAYDDLSGAVVRAVVEEAHQHDLLVIGHLGRTDWQDAVDAGIDALTHSWFSSLPASLVPREEREAYRDFHPNADAFDPGQLPDWLAAIDGRDDIARDLARRLAAAGTVVDPTLALVEATLAGDSALWDRLAPDSLAGRFAPHPWSAEWLADHSADAARAFETILRVVRMFHAEGVVLAAGTDFPNPWMFPGPSFHHELELLVRAGIPAIDALAIGTRNGAISLEMLDEIGTIEPGKRADLVVLSQDPLQDIAATRAIEAVYKGGRRVDGR